MKEPQMTIVNTDVGSIDLESLKSMAANPNVSAGIHGNGDVYISITTKGQ